MMFKIWYKTKLQVICKFFENLSRDHHIGFRERKQQKFYKSRYCISATGFPFGLDRGTIYHMEILNNG